MDLWVKPVILNPSLVILNASDPVILSKAKDLILLQVDSVMDLRDSSPECPEQSLRFFGSASE
jgi:hypothetical protein